METRERSTAAVLRLARPSDAAALQAIYAPYVLETAVSYEYVPPTVAEFRARICATLEAYPYLVLEAEGRILGYAYAGRLGSRKAYDWSAEASIYLDRSSRRQGCGRRLYEALESILRRQGVCSLYAAVACTDRTDDPYLSGDSVAFHLRMGYREMGRFRQCGRRFGRWYDLLWLEKPLAPHDGAPPPWLPFPQLEGGLAKPTE